MAVPFANISNIFPAPEPGKAPPQVPFPPTHLTDEQNQAKLRAAFLSL